MWYKKADTSSSRKRSKIRGKRKYEKEYKVQAEAAACSNIGINKVETMLREPNGPFVLYVVPNKKLVKRREFEEFIRTSFVI